MAWSIINSGGGLWIHFTSLYFTSVAQLYLNLWDPMDCCTPGSLSVHHQLPELTETHIHWVGDAILPYHPLSSPSFLPSIFPSIRVFSNESVICITWPKYWSFSFSISLSNEYSGLISFRLDWFDLLAVQRTLKSLLQHYTWKVSSVLSLLYGPTLTSVHDYWKNHSFKWSIAKWTFISKMMSLFVNMLSRLVITFLPRSKHLLISWL